MDRQHGTGLGGGGGADTQREERGRERGKMTAGALTALML